MFSNNYSIRDFAVSKFIVKKNKRQLVQGTYSLWGGSDTGVKADDTVKVTSKQIRDGVYDIVVSAQPGEYCFVFTNNGAGGFNSVFDFTIK
jgi:agmatine/peptidylarginine deiminase